MGVLLNLTKEYFEDLARLEEYVKFNTNDMKPVDMGGSVLWADRDLEIVDGGGWYRHDKFFTADEMFKMRFKDGWRVPTFDEFLELFDEKTGVTRHIDSYASRVDNVILMQSDISGDLITYNKLEFDISGRYSKDKPDTKQDSGRFVQRWTLDIDESRGKGTEKKFVFFFDFAAYDRDIEEWKKSCENRWSLDGDLFSIPVRLVKDKPKSK